MLCTTQRHSSDGWAFDGQPRFEPGRPRVYPAARPPCLNGQYRLPLRVVRNTFGGCERAVHNGCVDEDPIVVVGAGPAGSTAARLLAERGARVVLLEARRMPRPKLCGGGLTPKVLPYL